MSATRPPHVYLFFLSGAKKGKIESADAQVVRIGRQPYCEITLDPHHDIPASGDHCHIIREADGSYFLLDSESTFGTFLNGNQIKGRVPLSTGDVIECGKDAAGGREGPRLKFYLETDIRKCPICSAPVYKRHFRCPDCHKKTCLRCIDFKHKVCKHCGDAREAGKVAAVESAKQQGADAGFEVIEDDDVAAKRPAKVILKGKEAERLRKKKTAKPDGAIPATPARKTTGPKAQELDTVDKTFCDICKDFVKGKFFTCPACSRPLCLSHQTGKVCGPCAGIAPRPATAPVKIGATRVLPTPAQPADDAVVAELVVPPSEPGTRFAPRPPGWPTVPPTPPTSSRRASEPPRRVPTTPAAPDYARSLPNDSTVDAPLTEIPGAPTGRTTGTATCPRCGGRLGSGTFACRVCHRVLCSAHQTVDDCCEDCYMARLDRVAPPRAPAAPARGRAPAPAPTPLPPLPPQPPTIGATRMMDRARLEETTSPSRPPGFHTLELPASELSVQKNELMPSVFDPSRPPTLAEIEAMDMMPLLETERDEEARPTVHDAETKKDFPIPVLDPSDDLAARTAPRAPGGLPGMSYVCPNCDAPLPPNARACARCRRAL